MTWSEKLDALPAPAWLGIMVLGFIAAWPIGLAILGYMLWSGKMSGWNKAWSGKKWGGCKKRRFSSSGNAAFDEYRDEALRRLEEEQKEFVAFLDRLKRAKDQQEFDQFMAERNGSARPSTVPTP